MTRRSGLLAISWTLGLTTALASTALAQGQATIDRFAAAGPNQVMTIPVNGFTLFVPMARSGSEPILSWANGTNATPAAYTGLLTNYASYGIFVVASNSTQTGTGQEVVQGIDLAEAMTSSELVCTAGHSQGGSGTVNAARDLRVDCAMPIEPDTIFTAVSNGSSLSGKLSLVVCGTADNLAPCGTAGATRNGSGLFNQSAGPVVQVFNTGATHFAPVGPGTPAFKGVTTAFLAAALLDDPDARALFLGPAPEMQQVAGFEMNRFKGTDDPNLVVRTDPADFRARCSADAQCSGAIRDALFLQACSADVVCTATVAQAVRMIDQAAFARLCSADAACRAALIAALRQAAAQGS